MRRQVGFHRSLFVLIMLRKFAMSKPTPIRERFPPPWRVEVISAGLRIVDSGGRPLAYIYVPDESVRQKPGIGAMVPKGSSEAHELSIPAQQNEEVAQFGEQMLRFAVAVTDLETPASFANWSMLFAR
jgi:hypothetical protein